MVMTDIPEQEEFENTWNNLSSRDVVGSDAGGIPEMGKERVESLKASIDEIEGLIKERESLSSNICKAGEKMKTEINNFLFESEPKGDDDTEFARERAELRKKKIEISELQLNEKVSSWKDVALLKRELRERKRELSEKLGRVEMLSGILGDGEVGR